MSLGKPNLYIGGNLIQSAKGDPRPALAGLKIEWGSDSRQDMATPSKLSGQILVKGTMPGYLNVGATVALMDPATSRCLFAGQLAPLTAVNEPAIRGAKRVTFNAVSPSAELEKHNAVNIAWPVDEPADTRRDRLRAAMPAGWHIAGATGWDWVLQGEQKYRSIPILELLARYVRGNLQRYDDTSSYTPGAGLTKRLTVSGERPKGGFVPADPGPTGRWSPANPAGASGTAVLPASAIRADISWEKTPADIVTAIQPTTTGAWLVNQPEDTESEDFEWPLNWFVDSTAEQRAYGLHILRIETALSPQNLSALEGALQTIGRYWIDIETNWRPTVLSLPDSRVVDTAALLNLLAVDTRPLAVVTVPEPPPGILAPIRAPVMAGTAVWTGKKWETELTLGRTQ